MLALLGWQLNQTRATLIEKLLPFVGDDGAPGVLGRNDEQDGADATLLHLRKGDLFALRGQWGKAEEEYALAVEAGGGLPALRKLAQAQLQRRDLNGAKTTLEQLRRAGARIEDLLLLESIIELRTGELVRAKSILSAAADSPQKHYGLALLAIVQGSHEEAQTELTQVVAGWEPVLRTYARTLQSAYEEYALFPDSPPLHLTTLLAHSLAQVQECELALPLLAEVTNAQQDYRDAWTVQGFCELTTERFQESLASFERAYSLDPEKPEIQYFLARSYAALEDHPNAITFLRYALQNGFEPESEARRTLATSALALGDSALALEQYDELTHLEDADLESYRQYVTAAITLERKEEAFVKAQEASEKWEDDAEAQELLGIAAAESGREDEARAAFEKALSIDPKLESARERLGRL
jgi:tetratricopeptide (TPR) repeat protein